MPLGSDRQFRRYWQIGGRDAARLGGSREAPGVWVEPGVAEGAAGEAVWQEESGEWLCTTSPEELGAVVASLNEKGVRGCASRA